MFAHNELDRIQRALNEAKKRELTEKYGGKFSPADPSLPPDVEAAWLSSIEEFEHQVEQAGQTTVRKYIGDPEVKPLGRLTPEQLDRELERLFHLLECHQIAVHFGREVSDAEAYRFITEELLNKEIDDIRMDGMTTNFMYEEFHPDDAKEATAAAELFLTFLFGKKSMFLKDAIAPLAKELAKRAKKFLDETALFTDSGVQPSTCKVEGDHATVTLEVSWNSLRAGTLETVHSAGTATIWLQRSPGGWDVIEASVPGW